MVVAGVMKAALSHIEVVAALWFDMGDGGHHHDLGKSIALLVTHETVFFVDMARLQNWQIIMMFEPRFAFYHYLAYTQH